MKLIHKLAFVAGILVMVLAQSGCGPAASALAVVNKIPEITIHAVDFSYNAPTQIQSGLVTITLINDGKEDLGLFWAIAKKWSDLPGIQQGLSTWRKVKPGSQWGK